MNIEQQAFYDYGGRERLRLQRERRKRIRRIGVGIWFTLVLLLGYALVNELEADELAVQLHGLSYHFDRDKNYNEVNLGLGLRYYRDDYPLALSYLSIGQYNNSEYTTSRYVSAGWEYDVQTWLTLGVKVGLIHGYQEYNLIPFAAPTMTLWKRLHVIASPVVTAVSVDLIRHKF